MLMMVAPSVAYLRPVAMRICIPRAQSFLVNVGPDASCSAAPGSWLLRFLRGSTPLLVSISLTKRTLNADCTSCQLTASPNPAANEIRPVTAVGRWKAAYVSCIPSAVLRKKSAPDGDGRRGRGGGHPACHGALRWSPWEEP